MRQVTEWCENKRELQFAFDQIEKYEPGVAVFKRRVEEDVEQFCVCKATK